MEAGHLALFSGALMIWKFVLEGSYFLGRKAGRGDKNEGENQ